VYHFFSKFPDSKTDLVQTDPCRIVGVQFSVVYSCGVIDLSSRPSSLLLPIILIICPLYYYEERYVEWGRYGWVWRTHARFTTPSAATKQAAQELFFLRSTSIHTYLPMNTNSNQMPLTAAILWCAPNKTTEEEPLRIPTRYLQTSNHLIPSLQNFETSNPLRYLLKVHSLVQIQFANS